MMRWIIIIALAAAIVFLFNRFNQGHSLDAVAQMSVNDPAEGLWLNSYKEAILKATEKRIPILIDFTGSDWCGWCMKLDNEVFSQKEFLEFSGQSLVLLKIDFPRKKTLSTQARQQNEALANIYGIRGFPTILLVDSNGKILGKTGYRPGGAQEYVNHLKELLGNR